MLGFMYHNLVFKIIIIISHTYTSKLGSKILLWRHLSRRDSRERKGKKGGKKRQREVQLFLYFYYRVKGDRFIIERGKGLGRRI